MSELETTRALVAVSYDKEHMTSNFHAESSEYHVETPKRLLSILDTIIESDITLESGQITKLWDFLEFVPSTEVSTNILSLCHTKNYLHQISHWTKQLAKLNSQSRKKHNSDRMVFMYPLDIETYMTPKSETVARLAVGSLVELCSLIMKSTVNDFKHESDRVKLENNHSRSNSSISSEVNHTNSDAAPLNQSISPNNFTRKAFAIVRPPGHHATPDKMMGFCIYNNVAIAARYLQHKFGLKKIAIVDWDVHHGNGTQDIFYDDDSVCFISLHRYGTEKDSFYPYTGYCDEIGVGKGCKYNVNLPLEKGFTNSDLAYCFDRVVIPILERFQPEFIIVSAGFDASRNDLLGGCNLDCDGFSWATLKLCEVAEKCCKGRLLLSLEGGYTLSKLAEDVESVIKTLVHYEYCFNKHTNYHLECSHTGVLDSTVYVCNRLYKLLDLYDLADELQDLKIYNPIKKSLPHVKSEMTDNKEFDEIRFYKYPFEVDKNKFVIAGGHQNQWILPLNGDNKQIIKLCSKKEIDFFNWIYKQNGKTLEIYNQPVEEFKLQFNNGPQDIILTGIRLTSPTKDVQTNLIPNINGTTKLNAQDSKTSLNNSDSTKNLSVDNTETFPQNNTDGINIELSNKADKNGWKYSLKIIKHLSECSAIFEPYVFEHWKLGKKCAIRVKNALYGMKVPCVMDLKMGTRLYGDDCIDQAEIKLKEIKASGRCCKTHGFHISGIFKWDTASKTCECVPQKLVYKAKTDDELLELFKLYLSSARDEQQRSSIIKEFMAKLESLKYIFENQTNLAFYGSSLLFVFDASGKSTKDNVFMIDLSHVSYNVNSIDKGYLLGLTSIMRLFKLTIDKTS